MLARTTININGIELSVLKSGAGQDALVFIHGGCMSALTWMPQLQAEALAQHYSLVAMDLPGHGSSEWLTADVTGYHPKALSRLLLSFLEARNINSYILVGLSFGTNIIGELDAPLAGCKGIVLASPCILNDQNPPTEIITAGPKGYVTIATNPSDEDLKEYVYTHEKNPVIAEKYITDYRNTDPHFREQLGQLMMTQGWSDELLNIQNQGLPVCIFFGKNDSLLKTDYLDSFQPLWNNKVYRVEGAGHMVNEEQPETFTEILLAYAQERFK
jgi:pimeloyl-ACP methyl ester carboxylesterase